MVDQMTEQLVIVPQAAINPNAKVTRLAVFNEDGSVRNLGQSATSQADVVALTSTVAAGSEPTKAEFDALRADLIATRSVVNSLLAKLRVAGLIAT